MEDQSPSKPPEDEKLVTPTPSKKSTIFWPLILIAIIIVAAASYIAGKKGITPTQPSPTPETLGESALPTPEESSTPIASPVKPSSTKTPSPTPTLTLAPTPTPVPTTEPKADLYISEYSYDHPPKMGEPFTVKIGIYNKGDKAATGFWWEWWATTGAPTYACRQRIDSLAARGGRIVYCTYTYGGWANYTIKVVADADNEVSESDESNNIFTQALTPIH